MTEQNTESVKNFKIGVTDAKKFEIPEINDGLYDATLTDMELKVNVPDGHGGSFDMIQWNFDVQGKKINGKTSTSINPMSNAFSWITAISGLKPVVGHDFNPISIHGKKCQISIKHRLKTKTFGSENTTQNIPYVSDVFPAKK